jgi:hypothetical protein
MKGRIYERRSDISPDGRYFIYFAMNGKWDSETKGAWTAISKMPYLKALVLLGKGDCWHGGGLFTTDTEYWLNDGYGHTILLHDSCLTRDSGFQPIDYFGGECLNVYYRRLMRDGWSMQAAVPGTQDQPTVFEKALGSNLSLRKLCYTELGAPPGKGCYYDRHVIHRTDGEDVWKFPRWEWADKDGDRIVWAEDGKLFAARFEETGLKDQRLLRDFNGMTFENIEAPY